MRVLAAAALGSLVLALSAVALQTLNWNWFEDNYATIDVQGQAEVFVVPDVANFTFSVEAEGENVAVAQEQSGAAINEIMAYLEGEGVAETDIKTTNYNAYPRYNYSRCDGFGPCTPERTLDGYTVTQQVSVKVRDTDKAGALIGGVGERGATNMSGLSFTVDDRDALEEEARLAAIADAKEEAKRLAKELGVRLGDVLNFYEGGRGGHYPEPYNMMRSDTAEFAVEEAAFVPDIAVGENKITAQVTVTYKIK